LQIRILLNELQECIFESSWSCTFAWRAKYQR